MGREEERAAIVAYLKRISWTHGRALLKVAEGIEGKVHLPLRGSPEIRGTTKEDDRG